MKFHPEHDDKRRQKREKGEIGLRERMEKRENQKRKIKNKYDMFGIYNRVIQCARVHHATVMLTV
jgi:hypothetical protein